MVNEPVRRHVAYPAAAKAAVTIGHASYRVHIAAKSAVASLAGTSAESESTHSTSHKTTNMLAAMSSCSVMGVVCR